MQEAMIEVVKRHKEKARESEKDPFFGVEDFADKNREASLLRYGGVWLNENIAVRALSQFWISIDLFAV